MAGKTFGQPTVVRAMERQKDNIKMDCREIGYDDGMQLEQSCGVSGVEPSISATRRAVN